MAKYIEFEAAKMAVVEALGKGYSPFNAIVMLPVADVVPVRHGRWIEEDDRYFGFYATDIVCSECNKISEFGKFSYCPNCGAKMDKDGDGE